MPHTTRDWMIVLWPAFVAACLIEILVFASFDPQDMNLLGFRVEAERDTVYSMAFFAFWFVTSLVGLAVWSLTQSASRSTDARTTGMSRPTAFPPDDRRH
jgi:hypothetical protein